MPPQTLRLFEDHGVIMRRLGCGIANNAEQVIHALSDGGIDLDDVNATLENEGIDKFTKSFDRCCVSSARNERRSPERSWKACPAVSSKRGHAGQRRNGPRNVQGPGRPLSVVNSFSQNVHCR